MLRPPMEKVAKLLGDDFATACAHRDKFGETPIMFAARLVQSLGKRETIDKLFHEICLDEGLVLDALQRADEDFHHHIWVQEMHNGDLLVVSFLDRIPGRP